MLLKTNAKHRKYNEVAFCLWLIDFAGEGQQAFYATVARMRRSDEILQGIGMFEEQNDAEARVEY